MSEAYSGLGGLLSFEGLHEISVEALAFDKVVMLKDLGPWKKGTKVDNLWFNFEEMTVTEHARGNGDIIQRHTIEIKVKES